MYKYKTWNDENKRFGTSSNEVGSSWEEANKIALSRAEEEKKKAEERKRQQEEQSKLESQKPVEAPQPSVWDKSVDFVSKNVDKLKTWWDDYSFRMNEKSLFNPGRDQNYTIDENGKLKVEYPRLEKYKQAQSEEEKAQIRSEALQSTAEKTPLIRWLNSDIGKKITGEIAQDTSNIPLKVVARIKSIGDDTYDEAYSALMEERNDPTNPRWQRILYGIQDSGPQSAIGTLLAVGTSLLTRNPQAGQAVEMTYFAAISAESQRQEKGKVNSLGNIAIDTVGDTILSGVAEAALKSVVNEGGEASFKEFMKQTGKGFLVEGTTEPSQTFLKYANDYKNAQTEQEKQAVVDDLTNYVKNGGMVDEFLIGSISGGLVTGTATGVGMVAGKDKGEVNPSLQPNKVTVGGAGVEEEPKKESPKITAELDTDFSKIRDEVVNLEKKIETSADENSLTDLVALQDQLNDYQNAVKERPVYLSDDTQGSPLAEIETVKYPDGKYAFRFSADVDTASVSGQFSNTELFNSKNEAVKAGGNAIMEWAKNEAIDADEATTIKLNEMTAKVQDIIEGKNIKPTKEEFVQEPKTPEQYAPGLSNFDTSEEINAKYVSKAKESHNFEEFKKGLDYSTILSRIAPDVESDNLGGVNTALRAFYDKFNSGENKTSQEISYPNKEPEKGVKIYGGIKDGVAKLTSIEISKAIRGKGLGTKYVKAFEQWAKENGAKTVNIDAYKKSVGFWEKMGYNLEKDFPVEGGVKQDFKSGTKSLEATQEKPKQSQKKEIKNEKQLEAIKSAESDLKEIYAENEEKVMNALYQVYVELDIAEAGQKIFIDTSEKAGPGYNEVIGIKSSFPQWIPEEYRSKELFDKILGGLSDIKQIKFPDKNKTKQREFYNLLLDEVDNRSGIDTSKIREDIINNYEKIYAKETQNEEEAPVKKSVGGSVKGSQAGTEEINVDNFFANISKVDNTKTEKFKKWFGKSKVVDEKGEPLVVYHGSPAVFSMFDPAKLGEGADVQGAGFYFTNSKEEAEPYAAGMSRKTSVVKEMGKVYEVYLKIENPVPMTGKVKRSVVEKLVLKAMGDFKSVDEMAEKFNNDEEAFYETPLSNWAQYPEAAYYELVNNMLTYGGTNPHEVFQSIWYDAFGADNARYMKAMTEIGYDGIILKNEDKHGGDTDHYLVFNPNNIKAVGNSGEFSLNTDDIFASINDGKKLDEMLNTKEAKTLMSELLKETNPNLRAFLTLNLYKEITTQNLKDKGLYQGGWFDAKTNTVAVARDMSAENFAHTFKHEVGHAAFASLPMKEKQAIVEWYKTLDKKTLISLYGDETTLNDYLSKSEKQSKPEEFMADETVQRQMDQKNAVDSQSKILKPLRDLITKIVLALNKISRKILPSMAQRLKVQRLFKDVFSQTGGEKFAKSQAYLDELKLKGFRTGAIKDMETGFSTQKIDFASSVNAEKKTDEKVAKEFSEEYGYKPTFYARGEFADYEEKYGEGVGGMEHIKPLELPELVKMVKELTGKFPEVKSKFRTNRLGDAQAGTLRVRILASLFSEDKLREAKAVLAHELGHIVDYLPENARRSGNILGRIATLSKYLKHTLPESLTFGAKFLKAKEMKAELIALSEYWHPYDKTKASPNFIKYRESNSEIYADALSVLFNSPGLLQEKAPNFYDAFFKFLDKKPAVKSMFFELQDLLDGNREEVIKARQKDLREGFAKAEEIIKDKYEAKKEGNKNFWSRLRQQLDDQNYSIIKKQQEYEANGMVAPDEKNPKFLLDELPFVDNENYLLLDDMNKEVVQPIELAGMTMDDMGEYLTLNRIMNDRADVANPYGFTPDSAREQLEFLKKSVGDENFKMLEEKMTLFHEKVFASVEEAVKVGSYNKQIFEETIEPNKGTYAAFRVVDYIEENMPAGIKRQVGTFKEIANPFTATIIKTLSLNRLNAYQRAKTATIEMLAKQNEAEKSKSITTDGKLRIFKPAKGKGTIELLEDGKLQSYDVDPYIAERFDRDTVGEINRLVAAVDMFNNNVFKPLVTTYNMGFALAFNPIRDFKRNYKNIKHATLRSLFMAYAKSLPQAFRYAHRAELDEFTRSLVENKAIMAPINDYNFDPREDEFGKMLERYGLIKVDEKTSKLPKVVRKVVVGSVIKILEGMRLASNTFEIVSKIAGAKVRIKAGETGKSLYQNVRDYTGTPNWTRKGLHTRTTNAIFVFSNIMKEGLKSDYKVATNPETRAGFWWKTVKVDLLPKVMMFAASAGIIDALFGLSGGGDDEDKDGPIKKFFDKVSEYDKSNYIIIPLGTNSAGKAVYMRIPHDETGRLISAALWKMMNFAKDRELSQMQDIFAIGAGQLPSVTPAISIASNWVQYLSGRNPYDDFRGRPVIDDQTFQAGGWRSLKKMLQWTTNTMGVSAFATYDSSKDTTIETTLRLTPLFNRLIKVSDYGLQEQEYKKMDKATKEKAGENLGKKETIRDMVKQGAETEEVVDAVAKELKLDPEKIPDYKRINLIRTEVKKEQIRQRTGSKTDMLLKAKSNDSKVEMLKKFRMEMQDQEFWTYVDDLYENKVISANVYEQL